MSGPDVFLPTCPSMAASLLPRSTYPRLIFAPLFSLQRDLLLPSSDRLVHVSSPIAAFNRRFRAQNSNNSADATVVAGDENYGNKRVISVTPRLYDYLLSNVREPEILKELREETATRRGSQMQVSPDQAQLLAMLVQILGAEKCIEVGVYTVRANGMKGNDHAVEPVILGMRKAQGQLMVITLLQSVVSFLFNGTEIPSSMVGILLWKHRITNLAFFYGSIGSLIFTSPHNDVLFCFSCFTGYSSLAIALVLPESGRLVACERDMKSLEVAKRYYDRAGVSHKVDVKHGMAADALKSMIQKGESCSYDFAFVDAEKRMYHEYFELLLQLVRVGGLIVIDNVLWHGKVANPLVNK
ncbi:hypothetical protein TEA_013005 [Camellia sinensis var. sinensis]|uniref:Uncharacterized protein n=1 Tax=Camellia sinensis var. sinensis TaxID=542762 RepID=A0A4S4E684_CAMSN|nr:hypothetical protein TEA_013005 [Camellia sinensis var. sinensis]